MPTTTTTTHETNDTDPKEQFSDWTHSGTTTTTDEEESQSPVPPQQDTTGTNTENPHTAAGLDVDAVLAVAQAAFITVLYWYHYGTTNNNQPTLMVGCGTIMGPAIARDEHSGGTA